MRIKNFPSVESIDGSQDALVIEQTDGDVDKSRKVSPAQIKQYVLGNSIDDIYSVMGQMGAKNLIPYPYYESDHTESGITWTVNSDGSVTANGTATANSTFIFRQRTEQTKFVEKNTSYILSGCPSGGSNTKYMLYLFVQTNEPTNITSGTDYGNGATINMPDQDYYGIYAFARVISGQTVSNLTFKPMLRLAADIDSTYQPYAKTNKQLTEVIGDLSQTGVTGSSVAAQIKKLNDDLVLETFTPTLASAIGTPNAFDSNCFYNPKTKQVHIQVMIYSADALIPTAGQTVFTVESKYRPSETIQLGMAILISSTNWNTRLTNTERCFLGNNGVFALNNFVYGGQATKVLYIVGDYIAA